MIISLSRLNLLIFVFMIFGASMFQENIYFIKISFTTLIVVMIVVLKNDILKIINSQIIKKPFFYYLFVYVMYLFLSYISIFVNDAYNIFSSQVWRSNYLNILILIVSYIFAKQISLKYFKILILLVLIGFSIEALFVFLTHNPSIGLRAVGFGGTLQLGQDTSLVLSLTLSYIFYHRFYKLKYSFSVFGIAILFFYALYATGSRSPIVGLLIASIFIFFTVSKSFSIKNIIKIFFYLFLVIVILYFTNSQFQMQVNSVLNPLNDASNSSKLVASLILLKMFINNPILGTGLGTFEDLKEIYMPSVITSPIIDTLGVPHNMYLGILGEMGIFVFMFYVYIMLKPIFIYKKLFNEYRKQRFSYIFLGLMGFIIIYNVDSLFHNYYTQNFIWVIIGFGYGMLVNQDLLEVKNNEYYKNK